MPGGATIGPISTSVAPSGGIGLPFGPGVQPAESHAASNAEWDAKA